MVSRINTIVDKLLDMDPDPILKDFKGVTLYPIKFMAGKKQNDR